VKAIKGKAILEFEEKNCRGCKFSIPEKIGTPEPVCTYPGKIEVIEGKCLKRREK